MNTGKFTGQNQQLQTDITYSRNTIHTSIKGNERVTPTIESDKQLIQKLSEDKLKGDKFLNGFDEFEKTKRQLMEKK